jgi:hypothetical protein
MIELRWVFVGTLVGMLISTVLIPPNRAEKAVPHPYDNGIYHTDVGCVRMRSEEVPCGAEADSLNLLASKK